MVEKGRRSHLPGQLRPLEQPRVTIPSWEETWGMIELMSHNDAEQSKYVHDHKKQMRQAYDGWFDLATGKGRARLDSFAKRKSERTLDDLAPYTSFIRNKVMSGRR